MHDLFMSESLVSWYGTEDALVHQLTSRPLLVPPIVRTSLTDYNLVGLSYLITTPMNLIWTPKI